MYTRQNRPEKISKREVCPRWFVDWTQSHKYACPQGRCDKFATGGILPSVSVAGRPTIVGPDAGGSFSRFMHWNG